MSIIAISSQDAKEYGCPNCGYRSGYSKMSGNGATLFVCAECDESFLVLAQGVKVSPFGMTSKTGETIYPQLSEHPRKGISKHGASDKRPENSGEFFYSRGIGYDECSCFVCGTDDRTGNGHPHLNNIAAFVSCRESGQRVVAMFKQGARLDYREHELDRVQVIIGACDQHLKNLETLSRLVKNDVITEDMILQAGG